MSTANSPDPIVSPAAAVPARVQQLEVAVFLFLIVPSLLLSLVVTQGSGASVSFPLAALAVIMRDAALVTLLLYFLWRNGEPVARIGWHAGHPVREIAIGLLLFLPMTLSAIAVERAARSAGLSPGPKVLPPELAPHGLPELLIAALMVVVVAWAEETIFRGYLLLRLRTIAGTAAAVLLSCLVFAIGHGYEGSAGVLTVGYLGLIFALVYLWRRSLLAPITMHFLQDFLGIVLLPLLASPK